MASPIVSGKYKVQHVGQYVNQMLQVIGKRKATPEGMAYQYYAKQ